MKVQQFETVDKTALMAASLRDALRLIANLRALPDICRAITEDIRRAKGSDPLTK